MSSIAIEDVLNRTKVSSESLKKTECTIDDLLKLLHLCDPWRLIGNHLKLTDAQLNAIDEDNKTVDEKRLAVFKEWKQTRAFLTTYLELVQALVDANKIQNTIDLCKWFKRNREMTSGKYIGPNYFRLMVLSHFNGYCRLYRSKSKGLLSHILKQ